MNEDDLERLLRRYQPVGAPTAVRHRLLMSRLKHWMPAAGAVLVAALFYFLASGHRLAIQAQLPDLSPAELTEAENLLGAP